jgi:NAD(P)-dependent dehydrogenase (short-subunit alcohol dehydrogenase family)
MGLVASFPVKEASYCAAKGAIVNLTHELAVQWAGRGVRVNCIASGWFPSELTADMLEDDKSMRWLERNTHRYGAPAGRARRRPAPARRIGGQLYHRPDDHGRWRLDGALISHSSNAIRLCRQVVISAKPQDYSGDS